MSEGGYRPLSAEDERRYYANVPLCLVLTIVTAFVFNLFWNYRQMQACNDLLDRDEFSLAGAASRLAGAIP